MWAVGLGLVLGLRLGLAYRIRGVGLGCEDMHGYRTGYGEVRYIGDGLWIWGGFGLWLWDGYDGLDIGRVMDTGWDMGWDMDMGWL